MLIHLLMRKYIFLDYNYTILLILHFRTLSSIIPNISQVMGGPGLENRTRPLVFTSVSGCRASEYFDISSEIKIFPMYANKFCDAGQVPIFRYFEACGLYHILSKSLDIPKNLDTLIY